MVKHRFLLPAVGTLLEDLTALSERKSAGGATSRPEKKELVAAEKEKVLSFLEKGGHYAVSRVAL